MSVTDWSDEFLDSLRTQADPTADAVVAGLFAGTADATSAFRALVVQHNEVSDPDLAAFLQAKEDLPDWVDPDLVAAGQECFARWGSHVFTGLYAAALPSAYASWRGVQVLGLTARLETDAKRRLNETAQFHLDVMEPGGLEFGGRGLLRRAARPAHARVGPVADSERPACALGSRVGHTDQPGGPARDAADLHRDPLRGVRPHRDRVHRRRRRRVSAHVVADRLPPRRAPRSPSRSRGPRPRCSCRSSAGVNSVRAMPVAI